MVYDPKAPRGPRGPNKTKRLAHKLPYDPNDYRGLMEYVRKRAIISPYKDSIPRCLVGNEPVFYLPSWRSHCEGHIGTHMGMIFYADTRVCEYHKDEVKAFASGAWKL